MAGWAGFWRDPRVQRTLGTAEGRLAGEGLRLTLHREGRSALCRVHLPPRGSRAVGGAAASTRLRLGREAAGLCMARKPHRGSRARVPVAGQVLLSLLLQLRPLSSLPLTRRRLKPSSLCCAKAGQKGERKGRSEGQRWAKGPAPPTRHRDKSDLFILVKKKIIETTWHCIWLDP